MRWWNCCAGMAAFWLATTAVAAENEVISVPGVAIRADGSISVPGVEIGADGSISAPGVEIGADGSVRVPGVALGGDREVKGKRDGGEFRVETPGVSIRGNDGSGGSGGDNEVVITGDNGQINTSVSGQNLLLDGNRNRMRVGGRVLLLTVQGNNNVVDLEDWVERVVVTGNNNRISLPNDAWVDDRGEKNRFPRR